MSHIMTTQEPESGSSSSVTKKDIVYVEETNNKVSKPKLYIPVLLCLIISFGGFIFGWDVGTIGGMVNMKEFKNHFGTRFNPDSGLNEFPDILTGLIISVFNIGCVFGGIVLSKTGDFIGRKLGITLALTVFIIGILIQIINDHVWYQFAIGRIISGLGIGSITVLVPMFISESAPVNIRGAMVVLFQVMVTLGILCGNVTNLICVKKIKDSNYSWGIPLGLQLIWAFLLAIGLLYIPESAEYLAIKKMDDDAAKESFAKMNGISVYNDKTADFISSMQEKQYMNDQQKVNNDKWHEFITGKPRLGYRVFLGVLLMAFQQLTGINYFFYYSTSLFETAGLKDPYSAAIILSAVNFLATFLGIYLVESWGRKLTLLVGCVGMFVCMTIYASIGSFLLEHSATPIGMIVVTCIYIIFFATTSGPVTFVIVSELFPIKTRAISMAVCSSTNWTMNFIISLLTPIIAAKINFQLGYIFAFFLFVSIFFVWFMIPETKGKDTDQIDFMFTKYNNEEDDDDE